MYFCIFVFPIVLYCCICSNICFRIGFGSQGKEGGELGRVFSNLGLSPPLSNAPENKPSPLYLSQPVDRVTNTCKKKTWCFEPHVLKSQQIPIFQVLKSKANPQKQPPHPTLSHPPSPHHKNKIGPGKKRREKKKKKKKNYLGYSME